MRSCAHCDSDDDDDEEEEDDDDEEYCCRVCLLPSSHVTIDLF